MIRVLSITLRNFKNTRYGSIDFRDCENGASITGIYGQNGSSKTAVVAAFQLLKHLISHASLPDSAETYVIDGANSCSIEATFRVTAEELSKRQISFYENHAGYPFDAESDVIVYYLVELSRKPGGDGLYVSTESLAVSSEGMSKRTLINHEVTSIIDNGANGANAVLVPQSEDSRIQYRYQTTPSGKWRSLLGIGKEPKAIFEAEERIASIGGKSFVFSQMLAKCLISQIEAKIEKDDAGIRVPASFETAFAEVGAPLLKIVLALSEYSMNRIQVLTTLRANVPTFDALVLDVPSGGAEGFGASARHFFLRLDSSDVVPLGEFDALVVGVTSMNRVLTALVPGLAIEIRPIGQEVDEGGNDVMRVQVLSNRSGTVIPFKCESDGIKKLVSIMFQLIAVYHDESSLAVIDELDSGIFEFLLGEMLEVLCAKGKGQLVFTAHNLRPLEMMPAKSLVFTTTNPNNRYIRIKGYRPTNNLRDLYLRTINLGGQSEQVYEPTSKHSIDAGFYDASHPDEANMDLESVILSLRDAYE